MTTIIHDEGNDHRFCSVWRKTCEYAAQDGIPELFSAVQGWHKIFSRCD